MKTIKIQLDADHSQVLYDLAIKKGLSEDKLLIQALRLYQAIELQQDQSGSSTVLQPNPLKSKSF